MEYLEEFQKHLLNQNYSALINLWEEYVSNDVINGPEIVETLNCIYHSKLASQFGSYAEEALSILEIIDNKKSVDDTFRLIIDLQSSNSPELAEKTFSFLKKHYGSDTYFNEKIRLVGLRSSESFRGAIRNYELLSHIDKGKFVFHNAGWGTGEIVELSLVREQLSVEFENVTGRKDVPFETAFKTLEPIPETHFLARRFGDPDALEAEARKDPVTVIHMLLRDLGPKTAAEIKDDLCELVIPEEEWAKWWQAARAKLKKDTLVESPSSIRLPFRLRKEEVTHENRFKDVLNNKKNLKAFTQTVYSYTRDFPELLRNSDFKDFLKTKLLEKISLEKIGDTSKLELYLIIQDAFPEEAQRYSVVEFFNNCKDIPGTIQNIEISGLKKRALVALQQSVEDWADLFADFLLKIQQNALREYIFKTLSTPKYETLLQDQIEKLQNQPTFYPEAFVWFFHRILSDEDSPYYTEKSTLYKFFESLLILLSHLENSPDNKDLVKKIYNIISAERYLSVRKVLEGCNIQFAEEFLLLVSKCQTLKNHDINILQSLVEVVHPALIQKRRQEDFKDKSDFIWTTEKGYTMLQDKIRYIATVATVENAKEIETARSHGDLRENSEFKFALEKRSQLQAQIKLLSEQLDKARIITKDDIPTNEVGIGTTVTLKDTHGNTKHYTLLGPWDADTDKNILSFQSKFAQAISGRKSGDSFKFQDDEYTVLQVSNYFEE